MVDSQLGLYTYDISLDDKDSEFNSVVNNKSIALTTPWMLTVFNGFYHDDITSVRVDYLLEYYFQLSLLELGYKVGTYRNKNTDTGIIEEIDIVAIHPTEYSKSIAIECKADSKKNVNHSKISHYCDICDRGGIPNFYIIVQDDINEIEEYSYKSSVDAKIYKYPVRWISQSRLLKLLTESQYTGFMI